jgi:uncharacterized coiled-coil protein SlyX
VSDLTASPTDADSTHSARESHRSRQNSDTGSNDRLPALDARLTALERAVTDGETDLHTLDDSAKTDARLDELETRTSEIETRLDELDAAVQSLRGYVGAVRAVNREVERRADAALSVAARLDDADDVERIADDIERVGDRSPDATDSAERSPDHGASEDPEETQTAEQFAARVRDLL